MEGDKLSEYQQLINAGQFEKAEYIGDDFFRSGNVDHAIQVYKKMIERNYQVKFEIAGLGSSQISISRFEWFIYNWYDEQRKAKKIIGNAFDALSLCYLQAKDQSEIQKGILWYEDMLGTRESYELYMGYANLLCKKGRYDEAVRMYNRVIQHRPTLVNAYVCIAMIHEYRRIEKSKSVAMAKQILDMDHNNMYAVFILARNIENVDQKIEKLKIAFERFPEYVRIANDVGIAYGTKKQHRQAIKWYKKCIQLAPLYAAAYNNVGVRTEMLKQYQQALVWYFKACELDHEYKAAHKNATDIFDELKYSDDGIIAQMDKYVKLDPFMFYYYIGLAYYDKDKVDKSIKWYKKAEELNANNFQLMNSMGIAYDEIKKYDQAEQYYQLCIALNPKYHMAYYNMGILEKARKNVDKAAEWYRKAIEVNPRYNKPYNNLGNIYKNNKQYDEAVNCFEKAVELNTTYTLGWTNLAVCLLNLERYQDAFYAFARAKQLLPTDNNGLSEGNKAFLKESLEKFDKQGQKWKKTATISHDQKQNLRHLIHSYESNFKQAPSILQAAPVSNDIALRPQILEVVKLIYRDQFLLKEALQLVSLLKTLSLKDIQYFHILPQYLIQYFLKNTTQLCKSPLKVQEELSLFIKTVTHKEMAQSQKNVFDVKKIDSIIKGFGFPKTSCVNLFKQSTFFGSYEALYAQFEMANRSAEDALNQFIQLVEAIRIRSNGVSCGTKMTLPKRANQQFVIMTTIIKKILSEQINESWKKSTIEKLGDLVLSEGENATIGNVIHKIIDLWSDQITTILKMRFEKQIETVCCLEDLLRGKLMFESAEDLLKAVQACDKQSRLKGYEVLKCSNMLEDMSVSAVVINVKINDAVCELYLSPKHHENQSKWIESLKEIENSTFGTIFGSFLYLSRSFKYPLLANCKDIQARLKESPVAVAARYIVNVLEAKP